MVDIAIFSWRVSGVKVAAAQRQKKGSQHGVMCAFLCVCMCVFLEGDCRKKADGNVSVLSSGSEKAAVCNQRK